MNKPFNTLIKLTIVLGLGYLGYYRWLGPQPLHSHFLASIPVRVAMLPAPRVERESTGQISLESVINQPSQDEALMLSVMTISTAFDTFDEQDINELPLQDYNDFQHKMAGLGSEGGAIIKRGFIERDGQRGYEIVLDLGKNRGELVQHLYAFQNHMLVLSAAYETSARDRKTAQAFLDSVDFL